MKKQITILKKKYLTTKVTLNKLHVSSIFSAFSYKKGQEKKNFTNTYNISNPTFDIFYVSKSV